MAPLPRLMPALVTPFDEQGEIDLESHRHNLSTLQERGVEGFLIAGSTGEGPYLEPGERQRLVAAAREHLGDDSYLSCGVAAETVRQAVAMIQEAADGGADSALVITPTTLARNRSAYIEGYYQAVADSSPIQVLLYSVPVVTAYQLPDELVIRLSAHPNIVGMKDSGGDPVRMQRLVAGADSAFKMFNGSTQAVTLAITAGAHGAITASSNYIPNQVLETVETALVDPLKARELQSEISRIAMAVERHGVPGVKAASRLAGLRPGQPRSPLADLAKGDQLEIAKLINR